LSGIFEFTYAFKITLGLIAMCINFLIVNLAARQFWNLGIRLWYLATVTYGGAIWMLFWLLLVYQVIQRLHRIPPAISRYIVSLGGAALILYGLWQAHHLTLKTVEIQSAKIPRPVSIVQITDLHLGAVNGKGLVDRVVAQIKQLHPDLVVVTGDLFDLTEQNIDSTLRSFNELTMPAYFVFGNHDQYVGKEFAREAISHTPLKILQNSVVRYAGFLQIAGLDNLGHLQQDESVARNLQQLPLQPGYFTVLLSHVPIDFKLLAAYPAIDLTLAGHTHAGQLFPIFVIFKKFYPYLRGLYQSGSQWMYVSSGTSVWGPPMRLGTWSEITLIRLVPKKAQ
jgi:uncharacterized protein